MQAREEIKKLVALKPMTGLYAKAQDDLKSSEGTREQIMTHLKACDDKLSGIKASSLIRALLPSSQSAPFKAMSWICGCG